MPDGFAKKAAPPFLHTRTWPSGRILKASTTKWFFSIASFGILPNHAYLVSHQSTYYEVKTNTPQKYGFQVPNLSKLTVTKTSFEHPATLVSCYESCELRGCTQCQTILMQVSCVQVGAHVLACHEQTPSPRGDRQPFAEQLKKLADTLGIEEAPAMWRATSNLPSQTAP